MTIISTTSRAKPVPLFTFHWGVDNRGDIPGTAGLQESITFGTIPYKRDWINGYEWASLFPVEGLQVTEEPGWLNRFTSNIPTWVRIWTDAHGVQPGSFTGYFDIDWESIQLYWEGNTPEVQSRWEARCNRTVKGFSSWARETKARYMIDSWDKAAQRFMGAAIAKIREVLPLARIGYFGYPVCGYWDWKGGVASRGMMVSRNDRLRWLWKLLDITMPQIYPAPVEVIPAADLEPYHTWNVYEGIRCAWAGGDKACIPVNCLRYNVAGLPSGVCTAADAAAMFSLPRRLGAGGVATWDALESTAARDAVQAALTGLVAPVVNPPVSS
jgi:hypothetical protein